MSNFEQERFRAKHGKMCTSILLPVGSNVSLSENVEFL